MVCYVNRLAKLTVGQDADAVAQRFRVGQNVRGEDDAGTIVAHGANQVAHLPASDRIETRCLPPEVVGPTRRALRETDEVRELKEILAAHGYRRDETAKALGIGRTTLWRRMKALGLA